MLGISWAPEYETPKDGPKGREAEYVVRWRIICRDRYNAKWDEVVNLKDEFDSRSITPKPRFVYHMKLQQMLVPWKWIISRNLDIHESQSTGCTCIVISRYSILPTGHLSRTGLEWNIQTQMEKESNTRNTIGWTDTGASPNSEYGYAHLLLVCFLISKSPIGYYKHTSTFQPCKNFVFKWSLRSDPCVLVCS